MFSRCFPSVAFVPSRVWKASSLESDHDRKFRLARAGLPCTALWRLFIRSKLSRLVANCDSVRQSARFGFWNCNVPLPDTGNGFHGLRLVKLPSRRLLSNQTGVPEGGDGRNCTFAADAHCISGRSHGRLWQGPRPRSPNTCVPWPGRYQVGAPTNAAAMGY